jgi:transposase
MAYLRIDRKGSGNFLRIVENKRVNGKVLQSTLYSLGKVEDYTPAMLKRLGERFYELGGGDVRELLEGALQELGRYNYGYFLIYQKLLKYYQLDKVFRRIQFKSKLTFNLCNAVMLMLIERLSDPCSKLSNYKHQQEYLGIEAVNLQHLYRILDKLASHSKLIQEQIYQIGRDLFNQALDVVFYDVTTFYFESEVEQEGALRQKGFGKDGRIGNTQILFGLLLDQHKQPIAYQIYKGDTFEGKTFEDALNTLKKDYQISKVIVVADRGMLSKNNIDITTHKNGYEFIVGERLKNLPEAVKAKLLELANYKEEWVVPSGDPVKVRYFQLQHQEKTIIATYSEKRAQKDRKEREEKLEKAEKLLKNPSLLKKKAHHYFIKSIGKEKYQLDVDKIKASQKYDGFLAIATNVKQFTPVQILDQYRHLYQIEQAFRTFKSHLETRPMFHWTDTGIQGHICLCYIAYALQNQLQQKLQKAGMKISEEQTREILEKMQVSLVRQRGHEFYLRSRMEERTTGLLNKMGLKPLPNLIPKASIINYL